MLRVTIIRNIINVYPRFCMILFYVTSGLVKPTTHPSTHVHEKNINFLIVTYAHLISITMKSNIKVTSKIKLCSRYLTRLPTFTLT